MALLGNERVQVNGVSPTGGVAAIPEFPTTQDIANLGAAGAITIATFTAFVLTLPTTPTDNGPWLNGNVISYGTIAP
jgi:hypothetical protein